MLMCPLLRCTRVGMGAPLDIEEVEWDFWVEHKHEHEHEHEREHEHVRARARASASTCEREHASTSTIWDVM